MLEVIIERVDSTAVCTAIAAMAIGGVISKLRPFVASEKDILNRVKLQKQVLADKLSKYHLRVLDLAIFARGPKGPRLVKEVEDHSVEILRTVAIVMELETVYHRTKNLYGVLFASMVIGLIGFLLALIWPGSRAYVTVACSLALIAQLLILCRLRSLNVRMDGYEKNA